jgi:Domain of unknown function (DUF1905)/Bacteriocin-protection, YdeI or OmpD-Associated
MKYRTTIQLGGKTATGVPVPEEIVDGLGGGNRPPVRATIAGYTYQTTIARMRGQFMFPVSAAVREEAGVQAGDEVEVELELDTTPRTVSLPPELTGALKADREAREVFEKLSYTNQKRHALAVEGAKSDETKQRRLAKILDELHLSR